MKKIDTYFRYAVMVLVMALFQTGLVVAQYTVVIPGNFQSEAGCPGDWMPDCDNTRLSFNGGTGMWEGSFYIPAGCWEYKVAHDNSWSENYGEGGISGGANIRLYVPVNGNISFSYNPITHLVATSPYNSAVCPDSKVAIFGTFQDEIGCGNDWNPDCSVTALTYNPGINKWEGSFSIPAGCWDYTVIVNGNWNQTYGENGVQQGPSIKFYVPATTMVTFSYDPVTHLVVTTPISGGCPITKVVLPGTFQSTQPGYTCVWDADCNATSLLLNAGTGLWEGTFIIPAADYEFKVAINGSWALNYGLGGLRDGPNIPLSLPIESNITFKYDPVTHIVTLFYNNPAICVTKYYDANVNGYYDFVEPRVQGIRMELAGSATAAQYTASDGTTCFTNLVPGDYTVSEVLPPNWVPTSATSANINIGPTQSVSFGNVCLGAGGGHNIAYWMSKEGEATLNDNGGIQEELWWLSYFNLRNEDGSQFHPADYKQLRTWLQLANAKNMAYKLSAELAAMLLSHEAGFVKPYSILYVPACGIMGANQQFGYLFDLVWKTSGSLFTDGSTTGKNKTEARSLQQCLQQAWENANNNLNFVQEAPCNLEPYEKEITALHPLVSKEIAKATIASEVQVWPNPTTGYFNLRPAINNSRGTMQLKVYDSNGRVLYMDRGAAGKTFSFGRDFPAGLYFAEMMQGKERRVVRLVKSK